MKPLLVGEQNPYSRDPDDALLPYPDGSAGHRFCTEILDMQRNFYLRAFDRCNLVQGEKWSMKVARERAAQIRVERNNGTLILLGVKVAKAFNCPTEPFQVWDEKYPMYPQNIRVLVLPHPSGLCRVWNEDGAMQRARDLVMPLVLP